MKSMITSIRGLIMICLTYIIIMIVLLVIFAVIITQDFGDGERKLIKGKSKSFTSVV